MNSRVRVGIGYDIHRLVEGRPLILGGIRIEHDRGLIGHSDADVLLHAVTDALLGAAGLPDLGDLFPDTDPVYKDADSSALLSEVMGKLHSRGLKVWNLDAIIHAETPKLSPYKDRMAKSIASLVGVDSGDVNVKAKTNEGLGPLGCSEAIACTAVALVGRVEGR